MAKTENMYIANLAFLLSYDEGTTKDEIEYEIFKVAWQDTETIHYDRGTGGNFRDLEQEPANVTVAMWFTSNIIQSIYDVNREKDNSPYIVVGYNDITIENNAPTGGVFEVTIQYRLLSDILNIAEVTLWV